MPPTQAAWLSCCCSGKRAHLTAVRVPPRAPNPSHEKGRTAPFAASLQICIFLVTRRFSVARRSRPASPHSARVSRWQRLASPLPQPKRVDPGRIEGVCLQAAASPHAGTITWAPVRCSGAGGTGPPGPERARLKKLLGVRESLSAEVKFRVCLDNANDRATRYCRVERDQRQWP